MGEPLRIGERFLVQRRLGAGGMARVYLCWDAKLEVWCAVKVMAETTMPDAEARERFAREARSLARLAHPHIVWLYDLEIDRPTPYMVMEYLRGGSLQARLKAGVLHPSLSCRVVADAASALHAAHLEGIVHRDVKPQNLLLDEWGTVKVADFGVARIAVAASVTVDGMALGTWSFMAPEQLADPHDIDARVDVYALGATLFKMLVRRKPTILRSAGRREEALERVPEELRPIVRRATAIDPTDRYASARELEQALRGVVHHLGDPGTAEPLVGPVNRPPDGPPVESPSDVSLDELSGTWSASAPTEVQPTLQPPAHVAATPAPAASSEPAAEVPDAPSGMRVPVVAVVAVAAVLCGGAAGTGLGLVQLVASWLLPVGLVPR